MMDIFKSKLKLSIKGRNINRFIRRIIKNNIDIIWLNYIDRNEVVLIIYKKDYGALKKIKSIYEIETKDTYGYIKIKKIVKNNIHIIIPLIIFSLVFIFLTHLVFKIEIIHSNKEIRNLIKEELYKNGIREYTLKKDYKTLSKIKEKIIQDNKDKLEWIEIEEMGIKYIVRAEEREIIEKRDVKKTGNIVAGKDAIVKQVTASRGSILKEKNDFVTKGEVVISKDINLNEEIMGEVNAEGKVYGEVWYIIKAKYPFAYYKKIETGRKRNIYVIKFINKEIELAINKYDTKVKRDEVILSSKIIPLKLLRQNQKEVIVKSGILTFEEAKNKAVELSIKKMKNKLKENEHIIKYKYLKSNVNKSIVEVEMFFSVYEDIAQYEEIGEVND